MAAHSTLPNLIRSTAGAVPVMNEKGELTMQMVKVNRYVSGRRPEYAPGRAEDEEEEEKVYQRIPLPSDSESEEEEEFDDETIERRRELMMEWARQKALEEDILDLVEEEASAEEESAEDEEKVYQRIPLPSDSESEDEEGLDDEIIERRRELMRERARQKALEEDILDLVEEEASAEEESSEYEEYSDSEDETGPRLKPVFVRKMDRVTICEKKALKKEEEDVEKEKKRQLDLRKKESHRLVASAIASELQQEQGAMSVEKVVVTDDENEEEEYEAWKLRELKRIKRDREERENQEKEREDRERMHSMTEEERRAELKANPRIITNKAAKGKYKFLQKYYHRGAFYLENEENVLKRDITEATLEDHFDKTILPKVMQVKNFGRAGQTKYTHLIDQDTTLFDSPWAQISTPQVML